jgi:hypothetical protein
VTTEITAAPAEQDDETAYRNALMLALSAAEHISSVLPTLPTDFKVRDDHHGAFELELYFHRRPDAVAEFAALHSVEVQAHSHPDSDGELTKTLTCAYATTDSGVRVRAWALTDAEAPAVAA